MECAGNFNNSTGILEFTHQQFRYNNLNISSPDDIIDNKPVQAVFFLIYTTIFVLGIFGNVLVCYVVFRNKAMQTVTNLFITNLALSDILLCILAVPFTPLYTFLGRWVFGRIICHTVSYAQGASVYISTLTLTSIAIDRFFVIIYPFHPRMKLSTCILIIVVIWLFSIMVTLPYGLYMDHVRVNKTLSLDEAAEPTNSLKSDNNRYFCAESWPSEKWRKVFGGLTTTMQFVFPFVIMAFCYICVSLKLNHRARSKPGSKSSRKEEADRERKKRTNRMLIAMVAIFLISWLPLNVINIINDFYPEIAEWDFYYFSFFSAHAMAMSSTCYNPFLYAWLNENFRKEFKQVLPCFDPRYVGNKPVSINNGQRSEQWRPSERTYNGEGGNETQQEESLLPFSGTGVVQRIRTGSVSEKTLSSQGPVEAIPSSQAAEENVEVENILVPNDHSDYGSLSGSGVVHYDSAAETVGLNFITEEERPSCGAILRTSPVS